MDRKYTLILLALSLFLFSCKQENTDENIKAELSNITESVYASVKIKPNVTYYPQSSRSGIIKKIFVKENQEVKEGQELFKISPAAEIDSRLTDAQLNLQQAKANYQGKDNLLLNLQSEIQSVQQQLLLDSTNYKRLQRLWSKNIGTKIDLDRAKLAYDASVNRHSILKNKYAQTAINLENSYKRALNMVNAERSVLGDFTVRSQINGKIYSIFKEEGELINPQERFAEIGTDSNFIIEMDVDEVDITKINMGDTVSISLEAYPNEAFLSKISQIASKKNELTQTFKVESVFFKNPPKLYNGLSGEANIIISERKNAMVIPADYLMKGNKVNTPDGNKEIKVGVKNMKFVEVLSGIDTTTTLLKPEQ